MLLAWLLHQPQTLNEPKLLELTIYTKVLSGCQWCRPATSSTNFDSILLIVNDNHGSGGGGQQFIEMLVSQDAAGALWLPAVGTNDGK